MLGENCPSFPANEETALQGDDFSSAISRASGLFLICLLCIFIGFITAQKKIWPYSQIMRGTAVAGSLLTHGEVVAKGRRHTVPEGASRVPVKVSDPKSAIGTGYYALLLWDNELKSYAVKLYDHSGHMVHVWPIDDLSLSDRAKHRQNGPHAMEVLPDGSILVSFDWLGLMARLDACGKALWTNDAFYHHSFSFAADGGVWTWLGQNASYSQLQDIVKFDPYTGKEIDRISFNKDVVAKSPDTAIAFSMYPDHVFDPGTQEAIDIFHPNDVEELLPEMADAFPQFEAGDLLISIRELDMIAVISPVGRLKWYQSGPWQAQHDPDFEPDGSITVYDNSRLRPRSIVMKIDPPTRTVVNAIPQFNAPFKSETRGKHQLLPNGNRLITIPDQGQALEVSPKGDVIVEFNNVIGKHSAFNDDLVNAKWFPENYFTSLPSCLAE